MSASAPTVAGSNKGLAGLQRLGRSLMLPIATLPAAGLLLRLGQDDLLGSFKNPFMQKVAGVLAAAGGGLFNWLPLLFAVGIAVGFARKGDGSTAVAAAVGFVVFTQVIQVFAPVEAKKVGDAPIPPGSWPYGVLAGIVVGIVSALLWQRFYRTKLPPYLAFFGGRRFVPIINSVVLMVLGVIFGLLYPIFNAGLTAFGNFVSNNPVVGGGIYGVVNRLLVPFGLHNVINSVVWFLSGHFTGADGKDYTGDLTRFFHGDTTAGSYMTGFFPIFMFALPAAALAIWRNARPSQRKVVGGIMISAALTSFLTGITEPIEFSFMFVAWPLYLIHAVLTGSSHALTNALGIHDGFSFSAGAIDYLLNFGIAQKPLLLLLVGVIYGAIYYFVFSFVIKKWNMRTPGREEEGEEQLDGDVAVIEPKSHKA
ncbi:PTS transporter subunit EIIC [Kutzneria viridogrisea]|uniref:PTS system N-acetylglucosamine-specific IIC component n=2 Tax=Kutzneria TaxID=43356 RepID=A0ABR6BP80_9PSEU|nr:PTS transporter subunit EIIC [Kutzneria albida]AHH96089.1 Putative PTS system glucosamine-specific EIICBA component [Kutzneria albida DSM 43870]MBA8928705.1 PTS system N-acetylglucosamine-specific IIC component [Kutzneria viridogrisea]